MRLRRLLVCIVVLLHEPATSQGSNDAQRAREQKAKTTLERIKNDGGITTGQFSYDADGISLNYDGMIERQKLDCARELTTLLDVDFDTYDSSAPYSGPRRFIVKGPSKRLDVVAAGAVAAKWEIVRRADARDGIGFLEIETGNALTRREVSEFLDGFLSGDFADLAVGLTPFNLAGYDQPTTAVAFRASARRMYETLSMPSCGTPKGFDREALLKRDRDAVKSMEQELTTSSAGAHLAIAKDDAAFKRSKETGCWADDDVRFAKIHVDMVHAAVTGGIDSLKKLAPAVPALSLTQVPTNAVEFRYRVRQLVESTLPLCSWTTKGTNEAILTAALAHVRSFEDGLKGTTYAAQFSIAKEDATYDRSLITAECDDPGTDSVSKLSAEVLSGIRKQTTRLESLIPR